MIKEAARQKHERGTQNSRVSYSFRVFRGLLRPSSFALLILLLFPGCGYRVAAKNRLPGDIRTIAVLPLKNQTTTLEVEQILTRSLVRTFVEKTGYRVTRDAEGADAVLDATVSRLIANPVIFGQRTFGSTFLVTLNARVELRERESGKVLFQNNQYIFREQYVINVDMENFFSERNPALERIANDFASSVVTTILEHF